MNNNDWNSKPPILWGFIPQPIDVGESEPLSPQLQGLPQNILYAGIVPCAPGESRPRLRSVLYKYDPATYTENSHRRTLTYFPEVESPFRVLVIHNRLEQSWETQKYCGDVLVRKAFGRTYRDALYCTTNGGPEPDEPCDSEDPVGPSVSPPDSTRAVDLDFRPVRYWGPAKGQCPDIAEGVVLNSPEGIEIAGIVLKRDTPEVIRVRAFPHGRLIRYEVVDEKNTAFDWQQEPTLQPLTLRQLIRLIDTTHFAGCPDSFDGVVKGFRDLEPYEEPVDLYDFAQVSSDFYLDLSLWYKREAREWCLRRQLKRKGKLIGDSGPWRWKLVELAREKAPDGRWVAYQNIDPASPQFRNVKLLSVALEGRYEDVPELFPSPPEEKVKYWLVGALDLHSAEIVPAMSCT